MMAQVITYLYISIGIAGAIVVSWGAITSFIEFLSLEVSRLKGANICKKREHLRHHLGAYILLGLEFMIAADIMSTIIRPSMDELIRLGAIVAIRTVLSFFLNKEMQERHNCNEKV